MNSIVTYSSWTNVPERVWQWPNFTPREMACKHTGELKVNRVFMDKLQALRVSLGEPMVITSAYRSKEHPVEKAKDNPGTHHAGLAVDVSIPHGGYGFHLMDKARTFGFTGFGFNLKGSRPFMHIDAYPGDTRVPRPWIWGY